MNSNISTYTGTEIEKSISIIQNNKSEILKLNNFNTTNINHGSQINQIQTDISNLDVLLESKKAEIINTLYPINSIIIMNNNDSPNFNIEDQWQQINSFMGDKEQIFNSYFNTGDLFTLEKDSEGKIWFLIFDHNSNSGQNIFTYQTGLRCQETGKWSQWWVLKYNPFLFLNNGKYEFKMTYPDYSATGVNHWTQTSNPILSNDFVNGYSAISCTWTTNFHGLSLDNSNCLLSGQANTTNWWYAIAPYKYYSGGFPGPNTGSVIITGRCQVKIRVPQLEKDNILSTLTNHTYWKRIQ